MDEKSIEKKQTQGIVPRKSRFLLIFTVQESESLPMEAASKAAYSNPGMVRRGTAHHSIYVRGNLFPKGSR
jgi:hypothetical protein